MTGSLHGRRTDDAARVTGDRGSRPAHDGGRRASGRRGGGRRRLDGDRRARSAGNKADGVGAYVLADRGEFTSNLWGLIELLCIYLCIYLHLSISTYV